MANEPQNASASSRDSEHAPDRAEDAASNEASSTDEFSDPLSSDDPSVEELRETVDELRAEITRLKAQQARTRAEQSWWRRRPALAAVLAAGIGAAAGYGVTQALRPRRPRSLPDQARERLAHLGTDVVRLANRLRDDWGDWGAERREAVQARLAEAGRRLAQEAETAGTSAREGTRAVTERARQAGEKASERVREATDQATRRLRGAGETAVEELPADVLPDDAKSALEDTVRAATNGASSSDGGTGRSASRWLLTTGAVVAGGYLAAKVRRWL